MQLVRNEGGPGDSAWVTLAGTLCGREHDVNGGTSICTQPLCQLPNLRLSVGSLTILLFTSSSIALTSSAALGVSELVGRTNNREEAYGRSEEKEKGGGGCLMLVAARTANSPASSISFSK